MKYVRKRMYDQQLVCFSHMHFNLHEQFCEICAPRRTQSVGKQTNKLKVHYYDILRKKKTIIFIE